MKMLGHAIAYFCIATVFSLTIGAAYLWNTGMLTDEKVFRVVAMLYDVDFEKLEEEARPKTEGTPLEEPSFELVTSEKFLIDRNQEAKAEQLTRLLEEFNHVRELLIEEMIRRDRIAKQFDERLITVEKKAVEEGFDDVARQLAGMKPDQVKELFLNRLEDNEIDEVVRLMSTMPEDKLRRVLQRFTDRTDLEKLLLIHREMESGYPNKEVIDETRRELLGE